MRVNGGDHRVRTSANTPLLYVLRNELGLAGPKFGCGLAQCGACSVLINGRSMRSCVFPAASANDADIVTLEGLGGESNPHPVQQAFIDRQAMQCGYCANGMIITAAELLGNNTSPTRRDICTALDTHLCRCGSHNRIIRAIQDAAKRYRQKREDDETT